MAMSGSRSILGASDEIRDIYCEPCHQAGQVAKAEGYCVDCPEYLCGQCFKMHRRNKIMANHVLLDKDSMPVASDTRRKVLDVCEEKCPSHPSKVTEFSCETCDILGCHVCVTLDHRQCEKVRHIPDIVKGIDQSEELKKFNQNIKYKADRLSKYKENQRANDTSNNEMRKFAKQELQRQRAKVNTFFDELEKKIDDQITVIEKRNKDTLKNASDRLDHTKQDLDQVKNDVKAKSTGQNCELFIAMKRSSEIFRTLDDQFDQIQKEQRIQRYTLLPSEQIEAIMRTTTEICSITTARLESEIDIRTTTDKDVPYACIRSLTIVHGHYCVVTYYTNTSIKVIDTKSKHVTSEIGIEAEDIGSVTSVSNDQVAVSVELSSKTNQIQFFSLSASGVIQRNNNQVYDSKHFYTRMVYCKGNIYGRYGFFIEILSRTGKIIRRIQNDNTPDCIALCPDGQTIYVTDSDDHSVTSLTLDGKVKAVYKDKDLKEPKGFTVDKHGYVYVCSCGTKNIHQLTADLKKVQILIGDVYGLSIGYSSTEHKLYISVSGQIHVYSLNV